jgi:hypothetical protein
MSSVESRPPEESGKNHSRRECSCVLKWQRAHFDNLNRGGKQASAGGQVQGDDANRSKRTRAELGAYATSDGNHCEGCGIPRHKQEQCQLSDHPDFNKKGLWIHSSAFAAIRERQEAKGEQDKHLKLKWSQYTRGGTIANAKFPEKESHGQGRR